MGVGVGVGVGVESGEWRVERGSGRFLLLLLVLNI